MSIFRKLSWPDPSSDAGLVLRLLTTFGAAHKGAYTLSFLFLGAAAACTAFTAYLIGDVVNQVYLNRSLSALVFLSLVIVAVFTIKGLATYAQAVILARVSNRIVAENQIGMFDILVTAGLDYFADKHSSEFMMRVTQGARAVAAVLNMLVTAVGRDLLTLIGLIGVMVTHDPFLSLIGLLVMPPAILNLRHLMKRTKAIALYEFAGGVRVFEILQETIQGFRTIKAFSLEDEMRSRVKDSVLNVEKAANKMARVANRSTPLMETLGGISVALVFLYGGYRVLVLGATPGEFISFTTAFLLAYEPAKRVARLNVELSSQLVVVKMLFDTIDIKGTESEEGTPSKSIPNGRIEFSDVEFCYRPGEPVLRKTNFVAEPDKFTALVGPSGGGKSTILSLILRLYTQQAGTIAIDGIDIREISRRSLREQIAYVGQDVFLFTGTVRENIRLGKLSATEEEIIKAAKAAHAHEFISILPNGYDTPVGESGSLFSGGQRQRIAVARALIRNSRIILLDEATSSLDSESEREVQSAIAELRKGRTCLAVAHRLHTIFSADCIHVVESGVIVESGHHAELMQKKGRYADFFSVHLQQGIAAPQEQSVTG